MAHRKRTRKNKKMNEQTTMYGGSNKPLPMATGTVNGKKWVNCHTGNTPIFTVSNDEGEVISTLYAGGWTRGAKPKPGMVVIDLADGLRDNMDIEDNTGGLFPSVEMVKVNTPVLKLYIQDFGIPEFKASFWVKFANDVLNVMKSGKSILVACTGGHGRTGLVCAILSGILVPTAKADPIEFIRRVHCNEAVETLEQEYYVDGVVAFANDGGPEDFIIPRKASYAYTDGGYSDKFYNEWGGLEGKTTKKIDDKGNTIKEDTTTTFDDDETEEYLKWLNANNGG